jgi:hypothetical protein
MLYDDTAIDFCSSPSLVPFMDSLMTVFLKQK